MSIASRIEEIETHIGDVYDTINYSYDTTGVNKNIINIPKYLKKGYIDIINNGIDTLYNNFPKVSEIGSNLSLTPTYEAPMKLNEIQGNTLQDGTPTPDTPVPIECVTGLQNVSITGKNLFGLNVESNTILNITRNVSNGKIILNGTTNGSGDIYNDNTNIIILPAGTYTFSSKILNGSFTRNNKDIAIYLRKPNNESLFEIAGSLNYTRNTTVTLNEDTNIHLQIYTNDSGFVADNLEIGLQIEKGTQATSYEPYKGNTYEVNLGKNLFDKDNATILDLYIDGGVLKESSYNKLLYIPCKPNTTYTLQKIASPNSRQLAYTKELPALNVNVYGTVDISANATFGTITTGNDAKYLVCRFYQVTQDASTPLEDMKNSIQIEVGSQVTSYSPYFTPIELNKIGNYQDSIKKSTGKNLFDKDNYTIKDNTATWTPTETGGIFSNTGNWGNGVAWRYKLDTTKTYTLKANGFSNSAYCYIRTYTDNTYSTMKTSILNDGSGNIIKTFTPDSEYVAILFRNSQPTSNVEITNIQLEENSQATSYEPYGKVWYEEKQIGKVVLDGTENWSTAGSNDITARFYTNSLTNNGAKQGLSSYFGHIGYLQASNTNEGFSLTTYSTYCYININKSRLSEVSENGIKTWLSTHNTTVYYVLATPTYTEITNTELINQLEALNTAKSQEGTTNISITSEDLEMILNVSALKGEE